jgi:hypothetical protein
MKVEKSKRGMQEKSTQECITTVVVLAAEARLCWDVWKDVQNAS